MNADSILREQALERAVEELVIPHRKQRAYWTLVFAGRAALPIVERSLDSPDARIRSASTRILDRIAGLDSFPLLVLLLDDDSPEVRRHALHALACDGCKAADVCTPEKADVLTAAIDRLGRDPDSSVRYMAVEVVGRWVHSDQAAVTALVAAAEGDADRIVRKKAAQYLPGGVIHERTKPKVRTKGRT